MGFVIKLLAIAERLPNDEGIVVRVHPAMVPREHPLASVRLAFNAVFVEADAAGQVMFYGRGAGGAPTASAILGDVVTVARNRLAGHRGPVHNTYADLPVLGIGAARTRYAINLRVADEPGVLATIANAFAAEGVSLQTVRQDGSGEDAYLLVRTHIATEAALANTLRRLRTLAEVREVVGVMRVEGEVGN
jgi:homoserine dehydrogenase